MLNLSNTEQIAGKLSKYLPSGELWRAKLDTTSNLFKLLKGIGVGFLNLSADLKIRDNMHLPKMSGAELSRHEQELGIPNAVFNGRGDKKERLKDVIVAKYLMQDNTTDTYIKIAKLYGYDIDIYPTKTLIPTFPTTFPIGFNTSSNTLVIDFKIKSKRAFPFAFPISFGSSGAIVKLKRIYAIITPSQAKIRYRND